MKNQKGNTLLGALVIVVGLGVALAIFINKFQGVKEDYDKVMKELENLKQLNEISVSEGIQVKQAIFEFINIPTEITFRFKEEYKRPKGGSGFFKEKVDIIYRTDYTFTYGYNLEKWNWCASVSNKKQGYVQVRKPIPGWTNKNTQIAPKEWFTLEGIHYQEELGAKIQKDAMSRLTKKLQQISQKHLRDTAMNSNMERALKDFMVEVMNSSYENANPVSGIEFIENLDTDCNKI